MRFREDAVNELKGHIHLATLLPEELLKEENKIPDIFHMSRKGYQILKSQIIKGLIQNDFSELEDYVVNNPEQQQIWNVMILALYNCLYI